jgi:competence protein ComEC
MLYNPCMNFKPSKAFTFLFVLVLVFSLGCIPTSHTTTIVTYTTVTPTETTTSILPSTSQATTTPSGTLSVYFIDVCQGDSILLDMGTTEILIDAGDRQPGVVQFLKQYVDGDLEVVIATHPHADHIGGLIDVLSIFIVDQIWYNGESSTSKTYTDFMNAVHAENAQVHIGKRGDKITAGSLTMTVLNPFDLSGTTNNNSIVTELDYGAVDFLFEGDAEQESEARMLSATDIPLHHVQILKVGHHGSRTASSPAFLSRVTPETAVYMAKVGNSYGHPHSETIDALRNIGAAIYGTDVSGTITVTTDGDTYTATKAK